MGIAALITLILTEAPQAVDLIVKLRNAGRTKATEEELADLGTSQDELAAALRRLYPGIQLPGDTPAATPGGLVGTPAAPAPSGRDAEIERLNAVISRQNEQIAALQANGGTAGDEAPPPGA
jgi:hypothetical protein